MATETIVLTHFSPHRFRPTDFREPRLGKHIIPLGSLWLSAGDDWMDWCKAEHMYLDRYKYKMDVVIDTSQLIVLTHKDVVPFSKKFGVLEKGTWFIEWDRVREVTGKCGVWFSYNEQFDRWNEHAIKHTWFFGRDVTSVAIWSASCIIHVAPPSRLENETRGKKLSR